jgi:archaemetzincin
LAKAPLFTIWSTAAALAAGVLIMVAVHAAKPDPHKGFAQPDLPPVYEEESGEPAVPGQPTHKSASEPPYNGPASAANLKPLIPLLEPLHQVKAKPGPGDWLAQHQEAGQSFDEYLSQKHVTAHYNRRVLYVLPIGEFTPKQEEIRTKTERFLSAYFGLEVKTLAAVSTEDVPPEAKRVHPRWGDHQILTGYLLDKVLAPRLPKDGAALIGLSSSDLYPQDSWNFVFGMAYISHRVGVWSMYRYGNPDAGEEAYLLTLRRTLKVATHETGHMFGVYHCIKWECNMNGSNSLPETDRGPAYLCPECLCKLCYATRYDPKERYAHLEKLCQEYGLAPEAAFYKRCREAISNTERF